MLIGISGKKMVGKDTVGDHLVANHGFVKVAYADTLKDAVCAVFGWDQRHVNGELKEVVDPYWNMTPRHVLQYVGTELFRSWIPDIWVRAAMRRIMNARELGGWQRVVITDVRFPNEANVILEQGGLVWKVHRPGLPADDLHASETALDDYRRWSHVIVNDGTVDDLYRAVDMAL